MGNRFNQEQYEAARYRSSALEYALSQGYDLKRKGNDYYMAGHDSMIFTNDGRWFWNSQGMSGGAIEFITLYERLPLNEAVLKLNGEDFQAKVAEVQKTIPKAEKAEFVPPTKTPTYKQMYGYLLNARKLDADIISQMVGNGSVYPSSHTTSSGSTKYNVAFIGKDDKGTPRSAFIRGCNSSHSFKLEVPGSDKSYPFAMVGKGVSSTLCVFESAIDALSHASMVKIAGGDWMDCHRISQGGNAPITAIKNFLTAHPEVTDIELCFDNDEAGQKITQQVLEKLEADPDIHIKATPSLPPVGKDWNDFLIVVRETMSTDNEPLPSLSSECLEL